VSSYVVLARKWRPSQFSDIVGQGHIVRTLMNAFRSSRVHHAYLLTGSRGIGKTSIARIFAKALRCEAAVWTAEGFLRSCDECASCREIASTTSVDVQEIDGASNNGVDEIREIRENARFLPATGSRKIYIIDEVHMLTTAAFNALLKTLEEPPPHVLFLFATTEPHKIPGTILSRCQRFDLKRVTTAQIQARLIEILNAEGVEFEPAALALIARAAEGGMRDSLSLLDQVLAYSSEKVTAQAVRESIGLINGQAVLGILKSIFSREPRSALELVDRAYSEGHDLRVLARTLIEYLHAALISKVDGPLPSSLEISETEWDELRELATHRPIEEIEMIFQVLHHGIDWIARASQPRVVLDVLVIKCATAKMLVFHGSAHAAPPPSGAPGPKRPVALPQAPQKSWSRPNNQRTESSVTPSPITPPSIAQSSAALGLSDADALLLERAAPYIAGSTVALPSSSPLPTEKIAERPKPAIYQPGTDPWVGFIAHVRRLRPLLASILENGSPTNGAFTPSPEGELVLAFRPSESFYKDQLQTRAYAEQLSALGREFFGAQVRFRIELEETGETLAEKKAKAKISLEEEARSAARNHPIIAEARSLFGGELTNLVIKDEPAKEIAHGAASE
jgi:DNA polymerase-3 subunit gamma/tau